MAVELKFVDGDSELQVFATTDNTICVQIDDGEIIRYQCVMLSRDDAIKLSKELKKQINIINTNIKEGL